MKKNFIVLQHGNKDCGAAALLSIIRYYGGDMSLERIIEMTKTGKDGTNFYNISLAAVEEFIEEYKNKYADDIYIDEIYEQALVLLKDESTLSVKEGEKNLCDIIDEVIGVFDRSDLDGLALKIDAVGGSVSSVEIES